MGKRLVTLYISDEAVELLKNLKRKLSVETGEDYSLGRTVEEALKFFSENKVWRAIPPRAP
jgi:hypothetical protein